MKWGETVEPASEEKLNYLNQLGENQVREQQILDDRKQFAAKINGMTVEQVKKENITDIITQLVIGAVGLTIIIVLIIRLII